MGKILAFTGHRPKDLGGYEKNNPVELQVKAKLKNAIQQAIKKGYDTFISGMALGVDIWAAEIVLELKKEHEIKLIAALPSLAQTNMWPAKSIKIWKNILEQTDQIFLCNKNEYILFENLTQDAQEYESWQINQQLQYRNEWMVDQADSVFAVWKETKGGTGNCVKYAEKIGKQIICYNPDTNKYLVKNKHET